ncbi:MAG: GNAT family N-acetyltransferase [Phycisphaerae bacterium]
MGQDFELVQPTDRGLISRGIDCLLSQAEGRWAGMSFDLADRRSAFDDYCLRHKVDTSRQILAIQDQRIIGACLWVPTAGRTALFYAPQTAPLDTLSCAAQVQCIRRAAAAAQAADMALGQVILTPNSHAVAELYRQADFSDLATLLYMRRSRPLFQPTFEMAPEFYLVTYTPQLRNEFAQSIEASYHQTLDCPSLSGLRPMDDVINGHQAGGFDPELWFLLKHNDQNAGVLLMAHRFESATLELVYLGLTAAYRRMGLGTQLMKFVLLTAMRVQAASITLAVDRANTPAVHLYRKLRFGQTAQRMVLIHTLKRQAVPASTRKTPCKH